MCTCTSCKYTDSFSGWTYEGETRIPDPESPGFAGWPKGEPAGPRASAAAYAGHVSHAKSGIAAGWAFKPGAPATFPAWTHGAPGLPYPSKLVRDFIAAGYKREPVAVRVTPKPALQVVPKTASTVVPDILADFVRRQLAA